MRTRAGAALMALFLASTLVPGGPARGNTPRSVVTPPGQLKIITVNARQNAVLGLKRFEDLLELVRAMRVRPTAFNSGNRGGVSAPDIVVTQEIRTTILEVLAHVMGNRFPHKYRIAGTDEATSQIVYNPDTVTLIGEVTEWPDACLLEQNSGKKKQRVYQLARFTENKTGTPFAVASIHFYKQYGDTGQQNCRERNITVLRTILAGESSTPVFVAGDFNRRAVDKPYECDPEERSAPQGWYSLMTDGVPAFVDTVAEYRRGKHRSLKNQWTHEQQKAVQTCDGSTQRRRTRIDYIFASGAAVAEAGADDPGWSGGAPGSKHPHNHKYSDHRYVWGRYVLQGPPKPTGIATEEGKGGRVALSWAPSDGAAKYRIYRAIGRRPYRSLAKVGAEATSYLDTATEHGRSYRYTIAPIGQGGGQGLESKPRWAKADSRGPQIVTVSPSRGTTGVDPRTMLRVRFDERVKPDSVTQDRIRLFRGKKRLSGRVTRVAPRVLEFDPKFPLWKGKTHRVVVKPVRDKLGNVGGALSDWKFTVKAKKKRRR